MTWKAGETGNPDGARKRRQFEACVLRALAVDDFAKLRRIVDTMVSLAENGERWAVEMVRDTLDGKPAQQIIATDEDGRSLAVALIQYAPTVVEGQQERLLPSLPGEKSLKDSTVQ